MRLAEIQHFLLRPVAYSVKTGLRKRDRITLFYPWSQLYYDTWLPVGTYQDIFVKDHYKCPIVLPDEARIVDGGANIGLSSLYFLHNYPTAKLEAYEANPPTCAVLRKTLDSAKFAAGRYSVHGEALHIEACHIPFYVAPDRPSALNTSISGRDDLKDHGRRIDVPAIDIRGLLTRPIDLLKLVWRVMNTCSWMSRKSRPTESVPW